jgi:hypothetical protein
MDSIWSPFLWYAYLKEPQSKEDMSITQDGFIAGGKVSDGRGIFRSKESIKARKITWMGKVCLVLGVLLVTMATITLLSNSYIVVTPDTGFSDHTNRISSSVANYILGFYNIYAGLSAKLINRHASKNMSRLWIPLAAFAILLSFNPVIDPHSMKFEEWTKTRYGVTGVERNISENAPVVYPTAEGEKAGMMKKIDNQYFIYDSASDKEIPRAGDTVYVLTK